jgi:hypothetical protein
MIIIANEVDSVPVSKYLSKCSEPMATATCPRHSRDRPLIVYILGSVLKSRGASREQIVCETEGRIDVRELLLDG